MAEQKITIVSVEEAEYNGKEYRKITDADGKTWNLREKFKDLWGDLRPGTVLNAEIGIYMTKPFIKECSVESWGMETAPTQQQAGTKPSPQPSMPVESHPSENREAFRADPAKLDTTMRDTALMQATSLAVAGKINVLEIPFYADQFYSWLKGGTCTLSMKEVKKDVSKPSEPADTIPPVEEDKEGGQKDSGTDKDEERTLIRDAFVERLKEHGWSVGKAVFTLNKTKKYNIGSINDIPDFDQAYRELATIEKWVK